MILLLRNFTAILVKITVNSDKVEINKSWNWISKSTTVKARMISCGTAKFFNYCTVWQQMWVMTEETVTK